MLLIWRFAISVFPLSIFCFYMRNVYLSLKVRYTLSLKTIEYSISFRFGSYAWSSAPVVSHAVAVITSNYETHALNSCARLVIYLTSTQYCDIIVIYFVYGLSPTSDYQICLAELCTACRIMHMTIRDGGYGFCASTLAIHLWCKNCPVISLLVVATDCITVVVDK